MLLLLLKTCLYVVWTMLLILLVKVFVAFQKGKCAEYVLGVRVMCMCISGDILYVGLSSGSVLLINLQVK